MGHVNHPYEDLDLELVRVPKMIYGLTGYDPDQVYGIREKVDGQNFTFTVDRNGQVRYLGKGVIKKLAEVGGLDRTGLAERYADNPVLPTFLWAYDTLQEEVTRVHTRGAHEIWDVCRHGEFAVSTEVVDPTNPNIIRYRERGIWFIDLLPAATFGVDPVRYPADLDPFRRLCARLRSNGAPIGLVPESKWQGRVDVRLMTSFLERWRSIVERAGMPWPSLSGSTPWEGDQMSELRTLMVYPYLCERFKDFYWLGRDTLMRASDRLANGRKQAVTKKMFSSDPVWKAFQEVEADRALVLHEILWPLEQLFRDIGDAVLVTFDPVLSDPDDIGWVQTMIDEVKASVDPDTDDPQWLRKVVAYGQKCSPLERNMEGITFKSGTGAREATYKLTGSFAMLNRFLGLFRYDRRRPT